MPPLLVLPVAQWVQRLPIVRKIFFLCVRQGKNVGPCTASAWEEAWAVAATFSCPLRILIFFGIIHFYYVFFPRTGFVIIYTVSFTKYF